MGYVPNATQTPEVISAIRALFTILPAIAAAASLVIVYWFPINADNHKAILEGIDRHKRGESAMDPLTGREISPSAGRWADEASGWFLDNFLQRELERFLAQGSQRLTWDVRRAAGVSLAVCLLTAYVVWARIESSADPGELASLAVVVAGFALALFLFHLVPIGPARRLATGAIPNEVVRAHLDDCRQGRI
jgi:hypothetical protein